MPLEDLHALFETLKGRIQNHGAALRGSEALTRYALINPLLSELGWDTADPTLVIPEFGSGKGRADYALLGCDGKPAMMIEAKSLGKSLRDDAGDDSRTQTLLYCLQDGTKHFTVTDGQRWEIYETHREGSIDEKLVAEFDLSAQSVADVCLQALALWRPSLEGGRAVAGNAPMTQAGINSDQESRSLQSELTVSNEEEWALLSSIEHNRGDPAPAEIRFPDNSRLPSKYWNSVVIEVTRWLIENGQLSAEHCPIRSSERSRWCIANTEPVHLNGTEYKRPVEIESLWIEKDYTARDQIRNALIIIGTCGQDPGKFTVRFNQ